MPLKKAKQLKNYRRLIDLGENAVRNLATQIILAHNNPSSHLESKYDLLLTNRLVESGKVLGIEVMNYIIVSKENHFSFKDK